MCELRLLALKNNNVGYKDDCYGCNACVYRCLCVFVCLCACVCMCEYPTPELVLMNTSVKRKRNIEKLFCFKFLRWSLTLFFSIFCSLFIRY